MTNTRITLTRNPSKNLADHQEHAGTLNTYPLTVRGILKAAREWHATRKNDIERFGNIGAGDLTLTVNGHDVTHTLLLDASFHNHQGFTVASTVEDFAAL